MSGKLQHMIWNKNYTKGVSPMGKTEQVVQYCLLSLCSAPFLKWSPLFVDVDTPFMYLKGGEAKKLIDKHVFWCHHQTYL